ncbi:MAG TPA: hypothetical protein VGB16_02515 [candidate division Zixibacteria bacterium]
MNKQEQQGWLDEHIPYRLQAIVSLRWVCELLVSENYPTSVKLYFDNQEVLSNNSFRFLTNPMLEIGTIYCRVLLEFLGLSLNKGNRQLIERSSSHSDDIRIEDFGLKPLTRKEVFKAPMGRPEEIEEACIYTISAANKAVVHLTRGFYDKTGIGRLHRCSFVVPWLICEYLYKPLNLPDPEYKLGEPVFAPGLSPLK